MKAAAVFLTIVLLPELAQAQEAPPIDLLLQEFPAAALRPLGDATQAALYSLDDAYKSSASESFHGRPVLGKIDLKGDEAMKATGAFQDAAVGSHVGGMTLCFEPHHGLRITVGGHSYDYLLCYTCSGLEVFEDNKPIAYGGARGAPDVLNALLMSHHIPISPNATTEYVENKHKEEAEQEEQWSKDLQKWTDAMPASLHSFWPELQNSDVRIEPTVLKSLRDALAREFPDTNTSIRALFSWNGSGVGPWSGFPAYEETAELVLLDFSTADLVAAARGSDLTDRQTEGAARLFGGWAFRRNRPGDLNLLPATLKEALLEHVRRTAGADQDKLSRAESAFAAN